MDKKFCKRCNQDKKLELFPKRSISPDGYNANCKECKKEMAQVYYVKNREKIIKQNHEYVISNPEKVQERIKNYYETNRESINKRKQAYKKYRMRTDPMFALKRRLRNRCWSAFNRGGWRKDSNTVELLGADFKTVKQHMENKFTDGMNWKNRGQWHIDHIIPLCSAKTEQELIELCHYTNLQPLWAEDNMKKGSKII